MKKFIPVRDSRARTSELLRAQQTGAIEPVICSMIFRLKSVNCHFHFSSTICLLVFRCWHIFRNVVIIVAVQYVKTEFHLHVQYQPKQNLSKQRSHAVILNRLRCREQIFAWSNVSTIRLFVLHHLALAFSLFQVPVYWIRVLTVLILTPAERE